MSIFLDSYGWPILACLILAGMHVYLGLHIVSRKVIFVDLALAQIAAFGALWAAMMGYDFDHDRTAVMLYSFAFTVAGALLFALTRSPNERVPHEAVIGIIYAAAGAATLLLAAQVAHGLEAAKGLLGGRVDLVVRGDVLRVGVVCAAAAAFHGAFRGIFFRITREPEKAQAEGVRVRLWDFLFYLSFGVVITTAVTVAGVLLVFSYLVIPAVAAILYCERTGARLAFGWVLAGLVTVLGTYVAWRADFVIGPTIVCGFAASLVVLGIVKYVTGRKDRARALGTAAAFAAVFALFVGGMWLFRKPAETDEVTRALDLVEHGGAGNLKTALKAFAAHPDRRAGFAPIVLRMLDHEDESVRELALGLLGVWKDPGAAERLPKLLRDPRENVRRKAIAVAGLLADPRLSPVLIRSARQEEEPELRIEMAEAAMTLGDAEGIPVLVELLESPGVTHQDVHDVFDHLRAHVETDFRTEEAAPVRRWWEENRAKLSFDPKTRKFRAR